MKVLAIDASTKSSGVAVFEDTKLIYYDCYTASSSDMIKRIQKMINKIDELMKIHPVDKVVLEEVRPEMGMQNLKTHRALMWLQAAINFYFHENYPKVEIDYIYPSSWRKLCGIKTGTGIRRESLKPADIKFVKETYGLEVNDDIADAIGIGHAYVNQLESEVNWE